MKFLIREATSDDAYERGYVHYTAWMETYPGLMPHSFLDTVKLENRINYAKSHPENTLVAEVDGRVIGFVSYLDEARSHVSHQPASEIVAIYILKDYQRNGIGRALFQEALKRLTKPTVALFVLEGNQKQSSFIKNGLSFYREKIIQPVTGGELMEWEWFYQDKKGMVFMKDIFLVSF